MTQARPRNPPRKRTISCPVEHDTGEAESPVPGLVADSHGADPAGGAPFGSKWSRALGLLASTALIVGIAGLVGFGGYRYALTSPRFALRQIQIEGSRRATDAAIAARGELHLGANVISLDVGAVEERLLSDPWTLSAKVQRRLPATIAIEIVENEAGAIAAVAGEMVLLSRTGTAFKRLEPADAVDLPVITGACIDEQDCDPRHQAPRLKTAMEVIRYYERTALSRVHVLEEAHIESGGEVTLTIGRAGTALHLGTGPWAKKLAMAERVLMRMGSPSGKLPSSVFLDNRTHPERVVVRMR